MVKFEHKRSLAVLYLGKHKLEYTIEPRYWRNPAIWIGILLLLPLLCSSRPDFLTLITVANIYACIAIPLSMQMAGIGRVNFGPQLFLGIGGFTAALLSTRLGWGPWATLAAILVMGFIFGLFLSPFTNFAKGLYFSLITLILPLILLEITYVYVDVFKGEMGLTGITQLINVGSSQWNYMLGAYFSLLIMFIFLLIVDKLFRCRLGLYFALINDDEEVARGLGLDTVKWKAIFFIITSMMMTVAGWFFAHYFGAFSGTTYLPLSFMLKVLIISIIGGRGEIYGAVLGAYFVAALEKVLALLGDISTVVFPVVLIILLFTLPEGLYGLYRRHKYREYFPTIKIRNR